MSEGKAKGKAVLDEFAERMYFWAERLSIPGIPSRGRLGGRFAVLHRDDS